MQFFFEHMQQPSLVYENVSTALNRDNSSKVKVNLSREGRDPSRTKASWALRDSAIPSVMSLTKFIDGQTQMVSEDVDRHVSAHKAVLGQGQVVVNKTHSDTTII